MRRLWLGLVVHACNPKPKLHSKTLSFKEKKKVQKLRLCDSDHVAPDWEGPRILSLTSWGFPAVDTACAECAVSWGKHSMSLRVCEPPGLTVAPSSHVPSGGPFHTHGKCPLL